MNTDAAMRLSGQPSLPFGLEDAGGRERNLGVLGIGWRYSLLTGRDLDLGNLAGRKLSVSNFAHSDFLQAFGASPIRISAAEVFAAMEYGVVDGAIVDAERAMNMAEVGDVVSTAWSEDFTPFVTTHVVVISQVSSEIYGLKGSRPIAEQCSWTARDFTQRSIELARTASERGADATDRSAFEWRDRISGFSASHPFGSEHSQCNRNSGGK